MAEVLITLGIIGIVAAMTLPTVINNAQDRQFRAMFKKQVSVISQAMQMIYVQEENVYEKVNWQDMSRYVCKIGKQLNTQYSGLKCDEILKTQNITDPNGNGLTNPDFEWHEEGKWFDKTGKPMGTNGAFMRYTFYLPDGAMINFNSVNQIFIDVNGKKSPNTIGRDIFYLILPDGSTTPAFFKKNGDATSVNGYACPNYCTAITTENYVEDCKHGSGWGCSPLYILQ